MVMIIAMIQKLKEFDCSGLVSYAVYKVCGIELDCYAGSQYDYVLNNGKLVAYSQAQPGDILFFKSNKIDHVAIYSRSGKTWRRQGH